MNSFDKTSKNNIRGGGIDITTNKALNQQLDPALLRQALALIHSAQRIAVIAHEHPDGDCLGSALGLAHILGQVGKTCVIACADPAPGNLAFMPGIDKLQHTLDNEDYDLVIALDAGELSRFGSLYQKHQAFLEQQCKVERQDGRIQEQEAIIAQLTKQMETVVARLKEHDSEIQRANDQLQISDPATRVVATNH